MKLILSSLLFCIAITTLQATCSCEFFFDENYLKWGRDTVAIDIWGYSRMDLNKQFIVDSVANLPDEQQICIIECLLEKSKLSNDITLLYHEYTTDKTKIMYQGSYPTRRPYPYRSITSICYYLISAIYYNDISYVNKITFPIKIYKPNFLQKTKNLIRKIRSKIYLTKKEKIITEKIYNDMRYGFKGEIPTKETVYLHDDLIYNSHKKWIEIIKQIGMEEARSRNIHPLINGDFEWIGLRLDRKVE